jgi:DnaJ-class molecular chaperone
MWESPFFGSDEEDLYQCPSCFGSGVEELAGGYDTVLEVTCSMCGGDGWKENPYREKIDTEIAP